MTDTPHNPLAAPGIEKLREHLRKHPHEAKETDASILVSLWTKTPLYELLHLRNEVERLTAENEALRAERRETE